MLNPLSCGVLSPNGPQTSGGKSDRSNYTQHVLPLPRSIGSVSTCPAVYHVDLACARATCYFWISTTNRKHHRLHSMSLMRPRSKIGKRLYKLDWIFPRRKKDCVLRIRPGGSNGESICGLSFLLFHIILSALALQKDGCDLYNFPVVSSNGDRQNAVTRW